MSQDDRTAQEHLSPDERRTLLRVFADRMLLKVSAMDDPEDLPGVEKAMRVAAVIERVYNRCDRAECQRTEPRKLEAERAAHEEAAIKAQVSLAGTLKWGEERRQSLGQWWEAAESITKTKTKTETKTQTTILAPASAETPARPQKPAAPERPATVIDPTVVPSWQKVTYVDYTEAFEAARAELAQQRREAKSASIPSPQYPPPNSG